MGAEANMSDASHTNDRRTGDDRRQPPGALFRDEPGIARALDAVPSMLWIADEAGAATFFNRAWLDFRGRDLDDELGFGWTAGLHPDDMDRWFESYREARRAGQGFSCEYRLLRHDGRYRWVQGCGEARTICTVPGFVGGALDIHDRKDTQAHLATILQHEPECVKIVSADGILIDMNPAGVAMVEAGSAGEIVGRNVLDLVHPDDRLAVSAAHRRASEGQATKLSFRMVGLRGTVRWMETHAASVACGDGRTSVICVTRDITELRHLEEQLRHSQKMEAVGRLAGGIAHDFNNLLTVIIGSSELLADRFERQALPDELVEILSAAGRAARLTKQLLAFSRRQVMDFQFVDLNEVLRGMQAMLARILGGDIAVTLDLTPDVPRILADTGQLEQVVMNLAVNARDAMPDGGRLTLSTAVARLTAAARVQLGIEGDTRIWTTLQVRDTGSGMDAGTLARVFEPFFTTKAAGAGTGLGLATVYGIVKQSGGAVAARSQPGAGTTFTLYLPAARREDVERGEPPSPQDPL
jgi:hypothetical protein